MKTRSIVLFLLMLMIISPIFASKQKEQELPLDSTVRVGKLKNGLTYYIKYNKKPENQANFYIAQKVGSIQEEENQRGLAHFLEHMCFNGTDHFPGKGIINYLESIGVKFGVNLNAYTSIDETVYNINDVPTTVQGAIDSCLWILRDWADGLTLLSEEIDKERGVIHEEWRSRNDSKIRMIEQVLPDLYPSGNKYATSMPIGTMEVIDNFPHQALRDYYEKWYRPDLQGVIVVGDINVDEMEEKIKEIFSPIKMPKNVAERIYYGVEDNKEPIFTHATDKEQQDYQMQIMFKHNATPREKRNTASAIRESFIRNCVMELINQRIDEFTNKNNPPYLGVGVWYADYVISSTTKTFNIGVSCTVNQIDQAIPTALAEVERARRFGFTQSELDRIKASRKTGIEKMYAERDKRENGYYVNKAVNHFLENTEMMSAEDSYNNSLKNLESITLDEVNKVLPSLFTADNRVILSFAPQQDSVPYPTKEKINSMFSDVEKMNLTPYVEEMNDEPLISEMPIAGRVVRSEKGLWGSTVWTLSNGVKVVLKPTDFKADEVRLNGYSIGGTNRYPDSERVNIAMINSISSLGGYGSFDAIQLDKKLAGNTAWAGVGISDLYENISAGSTLKDIETMFQLLYLKSTSPRKDLKAFESYTGRVRNSIKDRDIDPNTTLSDSIAATVYNHHPRTKPFVADDVDNVEYDKIIEMYNERLSDMGDFTFIIVGNINLDSIKPLVEQYLGALPSNGRVDEIVDANVHPRSGKYENNFKRKMETPMGTEVIVITGKTPATMRNEVLMSYITQILKIVYTEEVREKEGGTYGVGVGGYVTKLPIGEFRLSISFNMAPERREELTTIILNELSKMAADGPSDENVEKVRSYLLKSFDAELKDNGSWMNWLYQFYFTHEDKHTDYKELLKSITKEQIRDYLKFMLDQNNIIEVSMTPNEPAA